MKDAKATVLLADDSLNDAELVRHAFREAGCENRIEWVCRGEDAVSYLKGEGEFADREKFPLPELMLLDLRMRGLSGWEFLKWKAEQPEFKLLHVVILTGSPGAGDEKNAQDLGLAYEIKPESFDELVKVAKRITEFWLRGG